MCIYTIDLLIILRRFMNSLKCTGFQEEMKQDFLLIVLQVIPNKERFSKHCVNGECACNEHYLSFSTMFSSILDECHHLTNI